jgi:hypothetical protein
VVCVLAVSLTEAGLVALFEIGLLDRNCDSKSEGYVTGLASEARIPYQRARIGK